MPQFDFEESPRSSSTPAEPGAGFDFTLRARGLLDQRGADALFDEVCTLLDRGALCIRIDARELGPVLPEGLRRLAEHLAGIDAPAPELAFDDLNDAAAIQLQLQGYAVDARRAWLGFGAEAWPDAALLSGLRLERETDSESIGDPARQIICEHCGTTLRVGKPGVYVCPACHSRIALRENGVVVFQPEG